LATDNGSLDLACTQINAQGHVAFMLFVSSKKHGCFAKYNKLAPHMPSLCESAVGDQLLQ
jgi:hypothetical protein